MTALELVKQIYVDGRQRWPTLPVTFEQLASHCARLGTDPQPLRRALDYAADIYLCCACSHGDQNAIVALQRDSEHPLRGTIARVCSEADFVRDTLQEFWQKLLVGPRARVQDYCGRSPLQAWLQLCASRLAIDRLRACRLAWRQEADLEQSVAEQIFDIEAVLTKHQFQEPFRVALRAAIASLSRRDRTLLRLHILERCSIDQIGRAYGAHRATAARWLVAIRQRLLRAVRDQLAVSGPRLTDSEFLSIARLLDSDLSISPSAFNSFGVSLNNDALLGRSDGS